MGKELCNYCRGECDLEWVDDSGRIASAVCDVCHGAGFVPEGGRPLQDRRYKPRENRSVALALAAVERKEKQMVNKVIILGRLGKDPEVRSTKTGEAVANFSVATSEKYTDKSGQKQEKTEWHRVVVWGKLAELCGQYLSKGKQAYIEGKLTTRQWQDKDGKTQYTTEIVAHTVQFLGSIEKQNEREPAPAMAGGDDSDDGMPF